MVKRKRVLCLLLALLMFLPIGMGALATTTEPPLQERRHPGKTGDEALLYDYLAGNLMHLTEC